jgi:hypothetical protein
VRWAVDSGISEKEFWKVLTFFVKRDRVDEFEVFL